MTTGYDPTKRTNAQLLADWVEIMAALRNRKLTRTNNNPASDIAEAIAEVHYHGTRGDSAQKGWDVRAADKSRVQVKAIRQTSSYRRTTLSAIRGTDFDKVCVVVFPEDFDVKGIRGYEFSREFVLSKSGKADRFPIRKHINGRLINLTHEVLDDDAVADIDLRPAAKKVLSKRSPIQS